MEENQLSFFDNEKSQKINLKELSIKYFQKWKLFAVLIAGSVIVSTIYLRYKVPQFEASTTILIKNNQKGGSGMSETSAFEDLSIFADGNSIENETAILSSRNIMRNVVNRLKLREEFYAVGKVTGFKKKEIYRLSPLSINISKSDSATTANFSFKLAITILNQQNISLQFGNSENKRTFPLNKWLKIKKGIKIKVSKNEYFNKYLIGRNYEYKYIGLESAVNKYLGKFTISQLGAGSTILTMKMNDSSKEKAQDILNELVNQYNEDAINDKNFISKNTSDFIGNRVRVISKELGDIEDSAKIFKNNNDITDVKFETETGVYSAKDIRTKFIEANTQLQLSYMMLDHLQTNNRTDDLIPINLGLSDNRIENIIQEHNKLVMERIENLKTTTLKNPMIINLSNRISEFKINIETSIKNLIQGKKRILQEIEKEEVRIDRNLSRMPSFEKDLRGIVRQQEIKEALYIYLLQKREEAQIALAVGIGNAKVVDSAYSNGRIVSPKKTLIYAGSLIFAIFLGVMIVFLEEKLYDKVNSKQDIERVKLPFIGNIPLGQEGQQIVISKGSKTAISEAFRTLRTNVDFILQHKKGGQVA